MSSKPEPATTTPTTPAQPQQQAPQLDVDDAKALACYANFCRVTGTPEEVILDLGLNFTPGGVQSTPVSIQQRVILNYFTAKRMLQALALTVQRHEQAFGVLETDIRKRIKGGAGGQGAN